MFFRGLATGKLPNTPWDGPMYMWATPSRFSGLLKTKEDMKLGGTYEGDLEKLMRKRVWWIKLYFNLCMYESLKNHCKGYFIMYAHIHVN